MLDREAAVRIIKTDKYIGKLLRLASRAGTVVNEEELILSLLDVFEQEADTELDEDETYFFVLRAVAFIVAQVITKYFDQNPQVATALAYEILEVSDAFKPAERIWSYYDRDVYKWADKRGSKYVK